jgi:hypothetical protein
MNLDAALGLTTILLVTTIPPLLYSTLSQPPPAPPARVEQVVIPTPAVSLVVRSQPAALIPVIQPEVTTVELAPQAPPTAGVVDASHSPVAPVLTGKVVPETPPDLRQPILAAATRFDVPSDVLSAALARESANFNPKYVFGFHVDGTGRGIAGIDKKYHPEVSDAQAFDPVFGINWEAQTLGSLIAKNKGDVYSALREYNGGPNFASDRPGYLGRPVSELTRAHADAIMAQASKAVAV